MNTFKSFLLLAFTFIILGFSPPATAADLSVGAKVFGANCAACHAGGANVVVAPKNLKQDTLKQYGMDSTTAIANQVRNGKNVMPAFKGRLTDEQIDAVAAYVLDQAGKGWTQ
jgi:cytochrome c6